jgi:hypothetical protein
VVPVTRTLGNEAIGATLCFLRDNRSIQCMLPCRAWKAEQIYSIGSESSRVKGPDVFHCAAHKIKDGCFAAIKRPDYECQAVPSSTLTIILHTYIKKAKV